MARINMYELTDELDQQFERSLKKMADHIIPGNTLSGREILRIFRMQIEREFDRWEYVTGRSVESD